MQLLGGKVCDVLYALDLDLLPFLSQIRWLLNDEIVSALRHSQPITIDTLNRVATHVYSSQGRPSCLCEVVPLQFVFGSENSLERFREVRQASSLHLSLLFPFDYY